ncbi:MAG TPA: hypothetical protein VHY37_10815 [Tepidisphaeraceae bacterium]|jgi:Spy/CpxP family protein refolding chaperone|nr:hypothetical protein [Tepidisphaeraceae bacterium]
MTTTNTDEIPKTRSIPVWLAVLLILACAGGGGYLAYKFLLGGSNEKIVLLERSADETIRESGPQSWWMRTQDPDKTNGGVEFDLANPAKPILRYLIFRQDLTKGQQNLLTLDQNRWLADQLHITNDQQTKLSALEYAAHVPLPQATADAMRAMFIQWKNTSPGKAKEDLENKLFSMLSDATQSLNAESKAKVIAKCEKVQAILTPQQLKQLESR